MANKQLINGKAYDWSSVTITASGMENMEPMEISYDDEEEKEPIYGKGGKIRGYGTEIRRTPSRFPCSVRTLMRCAGSSSQKDTRTSTSM